MKNEIIKLLICINYAMYFEYIIEKLKLYKYLIPFTIRKLPIIKNIKENIFNNPFINGNLKVFANSKAYINNTKE